MFNGQSDRVLLDAIRELDLRGDTTIEVVARLAESAATDGGYHMMVWRGHERGGQRSVLASRCRRQRRFSGATSPKTYQVVWPLTGLES